jgi:uroporphyrin-III C-methyltransferase/precorrin-2 dehydrogenase/sirohydrochlorin ferrochelatase
MHPVETRPRPAIAPRDKGAFDRFIEFTDTPSRNRPGSGKPTFGGPSRGIVHIVGAGPGDADLLTLRALRVLRQADVVVHDRLIGPEILDFARPDADRFYVGKAKSRHSRPQAEINALMVAQAAAGKRVVRLKGGDPFVFGRGGEEMEYLLARGIAVEVVPGITAATGCAAFAGISLTHRDHANAVTFITGHAKDGEPDLDWTSLANGRQTLVVYMGVSTAGTVARRLIDHGMAPSTPVAVVENGTLPTQHTVIGTLSGLDALIADNRIAGPALLIIGSVVNAAAANCIPALPLAAAG